METAKVVTVQEHLYAGIPRKVDEEYDAEERFVQVLITLGHVRRKVIEPVQQTAAPKAGEYNRRDMRLKR